MSNRKKIAVFYVGGTPGMVPEDRDDPSTPLIAREWTEFEGDLTTKLQNSLRLNSIDVDYFPLGKPLDSSHMNAKEWIGIAKAVEQKYAQYDGFVVIHGSDTMAYTGSALTFILDGLKKNVVLTGSNKPMVQDETEALDNLALAIHTAAFDTPPGVKIAFGGAVLTACRASKASQFAYSIFEAPKLPFGVTCAGSAANPGRDELQLHTKLETNIVIIPCTPDLKGDFYRAGIAANPPKGVILQTFEAGNVPAHPSFTALVQDLKERSIPTVAISQTFGGHVQFGKYAASGFLAGSGVINGADMTLEAALTKLMVVLGSFPFQDAKRLMERNWRGELTP